MLSKGVQFDLRALGKPRDCSKSDRPLGLLRTKFTDNQVESTLIMDSISLRSAGHLLLEADPFLLAGMCNHVFMQATMLGGMQPCLKARAKVSDHQAPELVVVIPHVGSIPVTGGVTPVRFRSCSMTVGCPVFLRPST